MNVLAVTASSTQASVAIGNGSLELQKTHDRPRGHAEFLNLAIEDLLKEVNWTLQDIDLLAIDHGPGSFTGLRVGASVIRTFSYILRKPCYVTTATNILRSSFQSRHPESDWICGINAFKNLLFVSHSFDQESWFRPLVLSPQQLEKNLYDKKNKMVWLGDGLSVYQSEFTADFLKLVTGQDTKFQYPQALDLMRLAQASPVSEWTFEWKLISPLYLRDSAAEENLRSRL